MTLRDVDSAARARLVRMASLSGAGAVMGYVAGLALVWPWPAGWGRTLVPLLGAVVGGGAVFLLAFVIVEGAGWAASALHNPSGSGVPRRPEHSRAEALAAAGRYAEAVIAFQVAALDDPNDPAPHLRIARIQRDHVGDLEEAVRAFKRARDVPGLSEGEWRRVTRELIELFTGRLAQPARAAPELARLAERAAGSADGEWAARELRAVKALIAREGSA